MSSLHNHKPRPHAHKNVNEIHNAERQGLNDKIAVVITKNFGSMPALYILILWMFGWMALATLGIGWFAKDSWPFPFLLFCSNLIQLWALPAIMVGQQVISRKAEIQADQQFKDVENSYHDIEQLMLHLDKQDQELLKQTQLLIEMIEKIEGGNQELIRQSAMLTNALTPRRRPMKQEAKHDN